MSLRRLLVDRKKYFYTLCAGTILFSGLGFNNNRPEHKFGPLLGKGRHGSVYQYKDNIVVKVEFKPFAFWYKENLQKQMNIVNVAVTHQLAPRIHKVETGLFYSYIWMDRVNGSTLGIAMQNLTSCELKDNSELNSLERAVISQINKLHDLGIKHGTLHKSNIMVNKVEKTWNITFIDFERAKIYHAPLTARRRMRDKSFLPFTDSCCCHR